MDPRVEPVEGKRADNDELSDEEMETVTAGNAVGPGGAVDNPNINPIA